ncbi:hypothetical protein LEP1GSC103_0519 [Leptospira borgpetersenii serovar Javanica str. UI 09931]|uniref:Uncharacterized protein n=5 Tax=Leptospira borgpetersenii TaxID=174 RepID=M3H094_LEPBO|nr:hypothetical protein LBBP_03068 [Leptospira borgpetersenii serovar Ballum]EKP14424.1 hypothetical protein LEP1GSC128_1426 [Leptospira borgpetersenii str. 200801926]EKQ92613.1 hypothetical protein LEP1GSC101_2926 [Leptospira borgpetersenii str. UI 09149]EKQ99567.1 hypothetical protein LEP1GSC121_2224 [Leptospira borgpetersenii serovar Castellonis str. 200801910]EMG00499.1 hypothetical protein LEP1GSC123_2801 [Leptospira borgpetersenii str. 200701203]EMK12432.1 hypothetical protein LEP1GSC066
MNENYERLIKVRPVENLLGTLKKMNLTLFVENGENKNEDS